MTEHPYVERDRRGYEAFAKGDLATLTELIADDVVYHIRTGGPLDGDYHGRDQVFGFFGRLAEETGGTFRLDVHDILANDEHTVVLATLTATREQVDRGPGGERHPQPRRPDHRVLVSGHRPSGGDRLLDLIRAPRLECFWIPLRDAHVL